MEELILTNETIDLYKGFLTEPGKYGCTYAPIDEVFEEFDGCTPKHILFDEYVKYINKPLPKVMFYIIMDELYNHLSCTEKYDGNTNRHGCIGYRLKLKQQFKSYETTKSNLSD
jgi:hypothetical protein